VVRQGTEIAQRIQAGSLSYQGRLAPLTETEKTWAKTAWRYIVNNTAPETGLVNSIDRYPATTPWHIGDYLAALVAARELQLIDKIEFDQRLSRIFEFMGRMDLVAGQVPNRIYHTKTGLMVDENNQAGQIGWSPSDMNRLLIWMKILGEYYPEYQEYLDKAVLRWRFCNVVPSCKAPYHQLKRDVKSEAVRRESRAGHEMYNNQGFTLWDFTQVTPEPTRNQPIYANTTPLRFSEPEENSPIRVKPLLSSPYLYLGMEFGWDRATALSGTNPNDQLLSLAAQADGIYRAQENRWKQDYVFTARTDHQLSGPPHRLYDSVFSTGYAWNSQTEKGDTYPQYALVATKAVFGMWVLWNTPYTNELMKITEPLFNKDRGWYEGRYEATGSYEPVITLSTNAAILEALLYKTRGALYPAKIKYGFFQKINDDVFNLYENKAHRPAVAPIPPKPPEVKRPTGQQPQGQYRNGNNYNGNQGGNNGGGTRTVYVEKPVVKYVEKPVIKYVKVACPTPKAPIKPRKKTTSTPARTCVAK
jgi:hypothetical protein